MADGRGASLFVDDGGLAFDDANTDLIVIDDGLVPTAVQVSLPDPDVNDSRQVTATDLGLVSVLSGTRVGDPFYDPDRDPSGDGRIDQLDEDIVRDHLGLSIPSP